MQYLQVYQQRQLIGEGSYGKCYIVRHRQQNTLHVAKLILIEEQEKRQTALAEVDMMQSLKNPFVVSYKDNFLTTDGIIIIMEYCQNGDLKSLIDRYRKQGKVFKESVIRSWFLQLAIGLQYLHSNKILHRDLKPANILISRTNTLKIADFGTAKLLGSMQLTNTMIGTYCYMSPEVCKQESYGYESDIWAMGCILYELCNLCQPFQSRGFADLMNNIINAQVKQFANLYSPQLTTMITGLLKQRKERLTMQAIMSSGFFVDVLREEYASNISKKMANESELFEVKTNQSEEIDEEIDKSDYVLVKKFDEEETIQSISNFVDSHPQLCMLFGRKEGHKPTQKIDNPSVIALSATFEEVEIEKVKHSYQHNFSKKPLGMADTNLRDPPILKFR